MKKNQLLLLLIISFSFFNCNVVCKDKLTQSNTSNGTVVNSHYALNSLDWVGTYKGIVPCANCEGIETVISLNKNFTYEMATLYLGKKEVAKSQIKGKFSWNKDGFRILLEGIQNAPNQYLVGENKLFQLDNNGNRITGNLSKNYELQKEK